MLPAAGRRGSRPPSSPRARGASCLRASLGGMGGAREGGREGGAKGREGTSQEPPAREPPHTLGGRSVGLSANCARLDQPGQGLGERTFADSRVLGFLGLGEY